MLLTQFTFRATMHFVHKSRNGDSRGCGFFINEDINYQMLTMPKLGQAQTSYESLFIKIVQHKITPLILGVIYRPPGKSPLTFNEEFVELVSELTVNKKEVILLGNFNLDLLKHITHPQTNNFLDVLISHHFLPAILQPTRVYTFSATLIDNIFTNVCPKMLSFSIIVTDISAPLPAIAWFTPQEPKKDGPVLLSTRKINDDDTLDQFRYLLSQQDFSLVSE